MFRDSGRIAAASGVAFHRPEPFPAHSLASSCIGMVAEAEGWIGAFTKAVFAAEFAKRADVPAPETLAHIVAELGHEPARVMARARSDEVKSALRSRTQDAAEKGIFGADVHHQGGWALLGRRSTGSGTGLDQRHRQPYRLNDCSP